VSEILDYDPVTGITHYFDFDEATGEAHIRSEADIEPVLEYNKKVANANIDAAGIRQSWWTYAKIPPIWFLKFRARGFKLDGSDDTERLLAEINTHAPALKCTQLNHGGKLKIVHDLGGKTTEG